MRIGSLAFRLFVSAAAWSIVALAAAGLILTQLYRQSVERAFDERLDVYVKTIVAALAEETLQTPRISGNFGEPRFTIPLSGWYWQISRNGEIVLASESLFGALLPLPSDAGIRADANRTRHAVLIGPGDRRLRVLEREIGIDGVTYSIAAAGNADEMETEILAFRNRVGLTLAVFGIGLVATMVFQVRFGLRPLERIRRALADIREGRAMHIDGEVPSEIEPLVRELNALLSSSQAIVERARTQVGNLAHALKTPLSVIINEARAQHDPYAEKVVEQARLMRDQVQHHLDRARIAARVNVIGASCEVSPVIKSLTRAMRQIHTGTNLEIAPLPASELRFRGERHDLEEMIGNLYDNACKWAQGRVRLSVRPASGDDEDGRFAVIIEDDGPGLSPPQRRKATRPGRRLDESKPGSGLGLSIVSELTGLYGGRLTLEDSELGGLRAVLELPAA